METPESVTEHTLIRDADQLLDIEAIVVQADDDLRHVAEAVAKRRQSGYVISVVDTDGRLTGVIPLRNLLDVVFLKIVPEDSITEIMDFDQVVR